MKRLVALSFKDKMEHYPKTKPSPKIGLGLFFFILYKTIYAIFILSRHQGLDHEQSIFVGTDKQLRLELLR